MNFAALVVPILMVSGGEVARVGGGTTIALVWSDAGVAIAGDGNTTMGGRLTATDTKKVHQVTDALIVGVAGRTAVLHKSGAVDLMREVPVALKAMDWSEPSAAVDEFARRRFISLLRRIEAIDVPPEGDWVVRVVIAGRSSSGLFGFEVKAVGMALSKGAEHRVLYGEPQVTTLHRGVSLATLRQDTNTELVALLDAPESCPVAELPSLCLYSRLRSLSSTSVLSASFLTSVAKNVVAFTASRDPRIGGTTSVVSVAAMPAPKE